MKINDATIDHSVRGFKDFASEISKMRESLFCEAGNFPVLLRDSVVDNYRCRIKRAKGKPLLGEYAPWILADILHIKDNRAVHDIVPSWMNLYAYTLFTDDILDRGSKIDTAPLLLASGLLLQRGLSDFFKKFPANESVRIRVDDCFIETAGAAMEELARHKQKLSSFTARNVDHIGRKVSFLKLCATGLLAADGRPDEIIKDLLVPIEYLATGMQLLDDVTDWEEDWQAENYSFLLTKTFSTLRGIGVEKALNPRNLSRMEVFTAIVITGALEKCLAKALGYLLRVNVLNAHQRPSRSTQLLDAIIEENTIFKKEVESTRKILKEIQIDYSENWLEVSTKHPTNRRRLNYLEKKLHIVAASS
jgi:hypothetical protein